MILNSLEKQDIISSPLGLSDLANLFLIHLIFVAFDQQIFFYPPSIFFVSSQANLVVRVRSTEVSSSRRRLNRLLLKRTLTVGEVSLYEWSPVLQVWTQLLHLILIATYFPFWSHRILLNCWPAVQWYFLLCWVFLGSILLWSNLIAKNPQLHWCVSYS